MKKHSLILVFLFSELITIAQHPVLTSESLTDNVVEIKKWEVTTKDNSLFALSHYDHENWSSIDSVKKYLTNDSTPVGIKWFRAHIKIDSTLKNTNHTLNYQCIGAIEIYIDGELLVKSGEISDRPDKQKNVVNISNRIPIHFSNSTDYIISVRYSLYDKNTISQFYGMLVEIGDNKLLQKKDREIMDTVTIMVGITGILFALGFIHLLIFFFYKKDVENLLFFAFVISAGVILLNEALLFFSETYLYLKICPFVRQMFSLTLFFFLHRLSYTFFSKIAKWYSISIISLYLISLISVFTILSNALIPMFTLITGVDTIRILIFALIKRKANSYIIATGFIYFFATLIFLSISSYTKISDQIIILIAFLGYTSIPISISVYLAKKVTGNAINLEIQLDNVKILSQKTLEQELEKKRILENQKEKLEVLVEERTVELREQKDEILAMNEELGEQKDEILTINEHLQQKNDEIEKQHQSITDSILYAQRIQTAVMPSQEYIDVILPDNFVLLRPRDKVSGDFYWVRQINHYIAIVAADCTGHGVPGAILSMLGISFINEIVHKREITKPADALAELRRQIKQALKQTGKKGEADDGMDLALVAYDTKTKLLQYAGANNPIYLVQNGELKEIKADRMPIGFYPNEKPEFTNHEIQLNTNDIFYLFSDGFMDQFGGTKGMKYKASNFKNILMQNHQKPMIIQKELLEQELNNWMKGYEQTDDILVIGVRV